MGFKVEWRYAESGIWYDYEASNDGRVRTVSNKSGVRVIRGELKPSLAGAGYPLVHLGRHKGQYVHRLVMRAFVGPCPKGQEVNHKDGIKTNNRLDNLEYVTPSENRQHAFATGLQPPVNVRGVKNPRAIITEHDVKIMRILHELGVQPKKLAEMFDVKPSLTFDVVHRRCWVHV